MRESTLDRRAGRVPVGAGGSRAEDRTRAQLAGGRTSRAGELSLEPDATQRVFGDRDRRSSGSSGDRGRCRLVARLAGDDPVEQRRWRLGLNGLVDAIIARAIRHPRSQFPHDHPFWGPFRRPSAAMSRPRSPRSATASTGWAVADRAVPSLRDLSLAVAMPGSTRCGSAAGPMSEMPGLYRRNRGGRRRVPGRRGGASSPWASWSRCSAVGQRAGRPVEDAWGQDPAPPPQP